jgi:hypothetical protein
MRFRYGGLGKLMYRSVIALTFLLSGCNEFPWLEKSVRLPDGSTIVRIMIRSGGEYRTVVENAWGSASDTHLAIAGAHRRINLYITPDHELVTIESGGGSTRFDISPGRAPKSLTGRESKYQVSSPEQRKAIIRKWATDSYRWRYIGVIYRGNNGDFAYYSPQVAKECISLLGTGSSYFRPKYQTEHFCS